MIVDMVENRFYQKMKHYLSIRKVLLLNSNVKIIPQNHKPKIKFTKQKISQKHIFLV